MDEEAQLAALEAEVGQVKRTDKAGAEASGAFGYKHVGKKLEPNHPDLDRDQKKVL